MPLSHKQIDELICAARNVAKDIIVPRFRDPGQLNTTAKAHVFDLVTEADLLCEQSLGQAAKTILSDAIIVGEEAVEQKPDLLKQVAQAERCVVIDPVDGTWNFASGLPTFGLLLAVVEQGTPVFGMLYDVMTDSWVATERGAGAHFFQPAKESVKLTLGKSQNDALSGFFSPFEFPEEFRPALAELALSFGHTTTLRCTCHEYLTLLQGHTDFIASSHIKPWDHLAGQLAVWESGGKSGVIGQGPYHPGAPNGPLLTVADPDLFTPLERKFSEVLSGNSNPAQ